MSTEDEKLLKEAKKLPWEDRLLHKNWKVRNDANIDLVSVLDSITTPTDPRIRDFGPIFKKTVADSNAPVQEKALDALLAFLRAADADAARFAKDVCDSIVSKCLMGRPKTVEKAQAALLLWIELEAADVVLDAMEKAIKNKVAKAVVPAIDVMFQALSEFGTKIIPAKKILKMLPELFDHQDQNVRASSKGLTLELCRWIGKDTVKSILFEKMRDTMKKELEAELVNVTSSAKPSRQIRSEQNKVPESEAFTVIRNPVVAEESSVEGSREIDEYELVDPVDILVPLDKSGFWDGVKAVKWSERRDAVADLTRLASTKRIAAGDFTEVCRALKRLVVDVNMAVAVEATQAIGNLAKGLRNHFSGSAHILLPVLLEKLKEKKPALTEALTHTLQAMYKSGCLTLADVVDDVKVAVKNKVPLVRALTLSWITYCIEVSNKATLFKSYKEYVPIYLECLNDGTPDVRDAAFLALAAVAKMVGMKPLERSLEKVDDVKRKKLSEIIRGCDPAFNIRSEHVSSLNGTASTTEVAEGSFVKRSAISMLSGRKGIHSASMVAKKNVSAKFVARRKVDGGAPMKSAVSLEPEDVEPGDMSVEEIEAKLGSIIKTETVSQLKSGAWKERLEAIISLKEEVENLGSLDHASELLIWFLCAVPGWGEKNVQVQQTMIEVITNIAARAKSFPKRCVVLSLLGICERVADIKTRNHAMKCLTTFCEAVGPGFVFERLCKIMKEHKNPKVLSEGIAWMVIAVDDFGVSHMKLKDLIDFCKDTGLQSSNVATRNSTIKLIGALHKFVGPDIKGFLSDVKPALLSALEAEYEKNPYEGMCAAPKRAMKISDSTSDQFDGLPREDISSKITPLLLKSLCSPEWKVRLSSIETINKVLQDANNRIQPTGTGELFIALKARLSDSNKNLVMTTLTTVGGIARAMGPAVEKSSKGILLDILKCLCDNKKNMRECTLSTLDTWVAVVDVDKMIPYITALLVDTKLGAEGRKDLFEWLSKYISHINDTFEALHLLKPVASSLMDKSVEVRKAAEASLKEIIKICGQEAVAKSLRDLRGPVLALVLERLKPTADIDASDSLKGLCSSSSSSKSNTKVARLILSDRGQKHCVKAAQTRTTMSKIPKQVVSAEDLVVQSQALFNIKDSTKEDRERLILRRYKFEEQRLEQIQELENDLTRYFREDLHRRLLSSDFKRHVEGIDLLQKAISSDGKGMIEVIDILLRWFVLRFCESNTTCLLKILDFLTELIEFMKDEGYSLTDQEASILFPCWIDKAGHNIEKVREKMRELTKQFTSVYSASKLFPYILEGLRSKNNRTRIECVDLVGYFIDHHEVEVSPQLRSLQVVAGLTSERDGEIRKAALNALATAYKTLGDDVWKFVGKLSDAQKSMLDDRFKWKAREMERKREGKPGDARGALRQSVRDNGLDLAGQSEFLSRPLSALFSARESSKCSEVHVDRQPVTQVVTTSSGLADWNEALEMIFSGSPEQSVEGMKIICHELTQGANDGQSSIIDDLMKNADRFVLCLANKVPKTFHFSLAGASSRSCKYVLNTLMQIFQIKKLAHAVKESTLHILITELLLWLLDERVPLMDDGSQLVRALNVLMLKILDNAERTSSFAVLINLLQPLDPSRWPTPTSSENIAARNHKLSELVVKCLIKLTRVLPSTIFDVDLDRVLQSIHVYFEKLGMEEIRRRAGTEDRPLRMVKTVLHELVKLRGIAIKSHLSMVPIDMEPQPIILAYIDLNLQTIAATRMLTPSGAVGQTHWGDSASNGPPAMQSADVQIKQELAAIFKKIGDKHTCTIGLYELYRITQLYPQVNIFAQLQNASEAFRTYIRDGLAQMEKSSAGGRTPNLPLPSPPPLTSPKISQHSPVQVKSVTSSGPDAMHIKMVHSGDDKSEDVQSVPMLSHLDSRQHDIYTDHSAGHLSADETLDSIRERMKSIQVNSDIRARPVTHENGNAPTHAIHGIPGQVLYHGSINNPMPISIPLDEKALSGLQARMERLKSGSIDHH